MTAAEKIELMKIVWVACIVVFGAFTIWMARN